MLPAAPFLRYGDECSSLIDVLGAGHGGYFYGVLCPDSGQGQVLNKAVCPEKAFEAGKKAFYHPNFLNSGHDTLINAYLCPEADVGEIDRQVKLYYNVPISN